MLATQPLKDPLGRMPLLLRRLRVGRQNQMNDRQEGGQLPLLPRLALTIARRLVMRQDLRQRMPISMKLRLLRKQVEVLRTTFLPTQFDPLGVYPNSKRVQSHARAFVVFCHAEIESYLEEWARDIAAASEHVWNASRRTTEPLLFLHATLCDRIAVPSGLDGGAAKDCPQRLSDASVKLFQQYYKRINENHGIKEPNVLSLFGPLGVPGLVLAGTLLPNLDSFGALRGEHAHHSARNIINVLDPETEYNAVQTILSDLEDLDEWLMISRRRLR